MVFGKCTSNTRVYMCVFIRLTHIEAVPLMKILCLQQLMKIKRKKERKKPTQLCLFFHMTAEQLQLLLGAFSCSWENTRAVGICIIVFRAIVGGLGLLTWSRRLATCPKQMNSAFVQYYLVLHSVTSE